MALWYDEEHKGLFRIGLKVRRTLFSGTSEFQKVDIIETESLGRALLLDDTWMTSEADEKTYHEPIVHPPLCVAPSIERVLIIGGGDGGTAREVLRYPEVRHVDMVEIDGMVVEACQEFLPTIGTAWSDPRLHVHIDDGIAWVRNEELEPYDVIIVDGADPVGPAEGLFNQSFFEACRARLKPRGVFSTQAESPDMMRRIHLDMLQVIGDVFPICAPYYGAVTIYPGAYWSWIFASNDVSPSDVVEERVARVEQETWLYNRAMHDAMFAVPNHIRLELLRRAPATT